MLTRRTAVGVGLAFASVACITGLGARGLASRRPRDARSIDALLVDETIEMPRQLARFIRDNRRTAPIVGIRLDAAAQAGLVRVLNMSHAIAGISSGATLFCLERVAWDHGFRLQERREWSASDARGDACRQDMAAFLNGANPPSARRSSLDRAYRPSRADGTLHAWVMQKSAGPRLGQGRQEA